jgi:dihydrofolate reductase
VARRAVAISQWRAGGQAEQPAQVRRVRDPRTSRLEQLDSPQGRRAYEVSTLKQHIDGDIVIAGSFQLTRMLIEHDLVDELRLKIFPVALGVGECLFGETSGKKPMRLLDTQTLEGGIAYLTYQSVREA